MKLAAAIALAHDMRRHQRNRNKMNKLNLPPTSPDKPTIVCLCGSSRFITDIALRAWWYESQGYLALGMHLLPKDCGFPPDHAAEAEGCADIMDKVHLAKIRMADFVDVMNIGGYIGERTRIEIAYAKKLGKPLTFACDPAKVANPAMVLQKSGQSTQSAESSS